MAKKILQRHFCGSAWFYQPSAWVPRAPCPQEPPRRPAGGHPGRVAPRLFFCPFLIYCAGCVSAAPPLCGQRVLVFNQLHFTALCFFPLRLPQDTRRVENPCLFLRKLLINVVVSTPVWAPVYSLASVSLPMQYHNPWDPWQIPSSSPVGFGEGAQTGCSYWAWWRCAQPGCGYHGLSAWIWPASCCFPDLAEMRRVAAASSLCCVHQRPVGKAGCRQLWLRIAWRLGAE